MTELDMPAAEIVVAAPATTANLGPAFDSVGLALEQYAVFRLRATTPSDNELLTSPDLATASLWRRLRAAGVHTEKFAVDCEMSLPQGMGLGSSASAIVAGQLIGAELLQQNGFQHVTDGDLLASCVELEGHPDNVAPCLLGGLTVTQAETHSQTAFDRTARFNVHASIVAHTYCPDARLSTKEARVALPQTVSHREAAANSARAFQLGIALTQAPHLLLDATHDYLHQDYRQQLYPHSWQAVADLRADGHAAFISGGGPAVVVLEGEGTPPAPTSVPGVVPWHHERREICQQGAAIRVPSKL